MIPGLTKLLILIDIMDSLVMSSLVIRSTFLDLKFIDFSFDQLQIILLNLNLFQISLNFGHLFAKIVYSVRHFHLSSKFLVHIQSFNLSYIKIYLILQILQFSDFLCLRLLDFIDSLSDKGNTRLKILTNSIVELLTFF